MRHANPSAPVISIRIRPSMRKQLDDLKAYGNNTQILTTALDRMWREELTRRLITPAAQPDERQKN